VTGQIERAEMNRHGVRRQGEVDDPTTGAPQAPDGGFSLVEVVITIVLM